MKNRKLNLNKKKLVLTKTVDISSSEDETSVILDTDHTYDETRKDNNCVECSFEYYFGKCGRKFMNGDKNLS